MEFYNVNDIMRITGCGRSNGYKLLSQLSEEFKREYPNALALKAKLPKWYVEKKLKSKEE